MQSAQLHLTGSNHAVPSRFEFKHHRVDANTREVSLTAPPPTNAAGRQLTAADSPVTEEDFYSCVDGELVKVENFTSEKVTKLRSDINEVEKGVNVMGENAGQSTKDKIRGKADAVAMSFLVLEKYVNINFMGKCKRSTTIKCT